MGYFVTFKDKGGKSRFNLKAGNHQTILSSEGYASEKGCAGGIASVQKNCSNAKCFEVREAKNGSPYFVLKAGNGEVIGKSEMYKSKSACNKGIASVKKNGSSTIVKEI
jgi:uncharacterized protein YegP (UPF0339 family)